MELKNWFVFFLTSIFVLVIHCTYGEEVFSDVYQTPPDTIDEELQYPIQSEPGNPFQFSNDSTPLYLPPTSIYENEVTYDPDSNQYIIQRKVGGRKFGAPIIKSFDEYKEENYNKSLRDYWIQKVAEADERKSGSLIPKLHVGGKVFETIFGSNTIDIRPQGSAELIFGVLGNRNDNPQLPLNQQRTWNFDFQQKIQMNVNAKIGERIELRASYNTEASFEFENKMNLNYEGDEDDILQKVELGDVSLPLPGSLISGSQSLFGIKTQLKFGRTTITSIFSQQKSESKTIEVSGGAQVTEFELRADDYEENKHFFLSHYFKDHYEESLERLPVINSRINITKVEVWVTNIGPPVDNTRNTIALQDLGEEKSNNIDNPLFNASNSVYPRNHANSAYNNITNRANVRQLDNVTSALSDLVSGVDYEFVENARKLDQNEYTLNGKLGFISLNSTLNPDQVLAVAFQYKVIGDTTTYTVGEFSTGTVEGNNALIMKLLKSTALDTDTKMWELMMKNVYPLGGYQINSDDFRLNILYKDDRNGVPSAFLAESDIKGHPLIRVLGMDRLNTLQQNYPDGIFDFIDGAATGGGTIQASNGRVYFPVLEPFGDALRDSIGNDNLANKYCFDSLYSMAKYNAREYPEKNKFIIAGQYKSQGGSEISLNAMNIPQGSVNVTAGGIPLEENVHYTVDYTLGRVKIIDESILNSGTPIRVNFESNSLFNIQTKTLLGTHVDYEVNKNFIVGATVMNLTERPLTQKINMGDEPISNTIWGLNASYQTQSRLLTKMVDKIPFIDTKEESNVTVDAEFANLMPGHARAIGKAGTSYIDDFEGSKSSIDLKEMISWELASTPSDETLFPDANANSLEYGKNRANIAWYIIDPVFYSDNNLTPSHIRKDAAQLSNHYARQVLQNEIFPKKELPSGQPANQPVLNVAYYPNERGPYNFDYDGIQPDGTLNNPQQRWGGFMRALSNTDFEALNVEYIEFWMMDPFIYNDDHTGGNLYINLGDVSEDILKDGRKMFEHGLPEGATLENVDTTIWGRVPSLQALTNSFTSAESREYQDVGFDGLNDADEQLFYNEFVNSIQNAGLQQAVVQDILDDPSTDNFHYFLGEDYDNQKLSILNRYKKYNLPDGNSPAASNEAATSLPDIEDINRDNTLNRSERFYQYRVQLRPGMMNVGQNYITDVREASVTLKNGQTETVKWYQFKVPVSQPDKTVGSIEGFKSIRFMRLFFHGFSEPVVCRFGTFELVRGEWRKLNKSLLAPGEYIPDDDNSTSFNISSVNIEENAERTPINYVVPPGIDREINVGSTNLNKMNEQSLVLNVCNLEDGDSRAIYKTADFDVRRYGKIKMFAHAERVMENQNLESGDLTLFVRLGTDFTENYYEYEIPLELTEWGNHRDVDVWPESNELDLKLQKFVDAKQNRNVQMRGGNSSVNLTTPFIQFDGKNKITVVGNPNLSSVNAILIGVRNPKLKSSTMGSDDGIAKCAEIWINELRLTDFDEEGGWAVNTRVAANLADLGNVVVAGTHSTAGFGSIEQKINERQNDNITRYDIATNVELGKFLPEKTGIRIPFHFDYSETKKNPQYNPLSPDIEFKDDLETYESEKAKSELKKKVQDYTMQKSLNFTNVRKEKTGKSSKSHIYDVENLNFTYAYTEIFHRDIDIKYNNQKRYNVAIGYNFNNNPKNFKPFSKIKFLTKVKPLKLIKDFNFYLAPKVISFRNDFNRTYERNLFRNKMDDAIIPIEPNYIKTFDWNRAYNLKFDLTQGLQIDYSANAASWIREPQGKIEKPWYKDTSITNSMKDLGELNNYDQNVNVSYNVPVNKLPLMDWISFRIQYSGQYNWQKAPEAAPEIGNTIHNSNSWRFNPGLNFVNLYNKIGYLKEINEKGNKRSRRRAGRYEAEPQENDSVQNQGMKKIFKGVLDNTLRAMMALRNMTFSYTRNIGFQLPGFMQTPAYVGQDWDASPYAPGTDFVLGSPFAEEHETTILFRASENGWLSPDPALNNPFSSQFAEKYDARATLEPIPKLKIDLTANKQLSSNKTTYFAVDSLSGRVDRSSLDPLESGNFSISFITWQTAWVKDDDKDRSENFEAFRAYRDEISRRHSGQNRFSQGEVDTTRYYDGYSATSQQVLIPAFIAAYTGKDVSDVELDPFPEIPIPNWRITYDGLSDFEFIQKFLKRLTLSHGYLSTYSVGNYATLTQYEEDRGIRYSNGDFLPRYEIGQVAIREQFNPLFQIDATLHNSLMTSFAIKKGRDLALSFTNNQITEVASDEYVIGLGYRVKDLTLIISKNPITSDLNLKTDLSFRKNKTVLRKIIENSNTPSSGQRMVSINSSADYMFSKSLTLRVFFDKIITVPYIEPPYRSSNTHAGFSLRFTLMQ